MKPVYSSRKSASDLKHLAALKDSAIVVDDDAPVWTPEMFARAVVKRGLASPTAKTLLSLRVDSDVVEWFRGQGAAINPAGTRSCALTWTHIVKVESVRANLSLNTDVPLAALRAVRRVAG